MNFDQLRTFIVASEELNFTKTAEILHLTQPAISQQIKELEIFFQLPLFERRGRQVQLSSAGERLRPYARDVLATIDEARTALLELAGKTYGKLLVGSGNTLGTYLLPRLLGRFQQDYPHVLVSLKVAETSEIVEMLGHGELDLALLEESPTESRLRQLLRTPCVEDELVLIAPTAAADQVERFPNGPIACKALQTLPLILRQPSSRTRHLIQGHLIRAGIDLERLNVMMELGNTEGLKQAVMAGLGLAFVSPFAIQSELQAGLLRVVPVTNLQIRRQLWLVSQNHRHLPERVQLFQSFLLEACAGIAQPATQSAAPGVSFGGRTG